MKNFKFIDAKESYRLAQNFEYPNGFYEYRFDIKGTHCNLMSSSYIGLCWKILVCYLEARKFKKKFEEAKESIKANEKRLGLTWQK